MGPMYAPYLMRHPVDEVDDALGAPDIPGADAASAVSARAHNHARARKDRHQVGDSVTHSGSRYFRTALLGDIPHLLHRHRASGYHDRAVTSAQGTTYLPCSARNGAAPR